MFFRHAIYYVICFRIYIFTAIINHLSVAYIKLLRPKDWAKNLFLFIPLFFSGELFNWTKYPPLLAGILAFSCLASSIYIINDYRDIEDDRKHHEKLKRPLASGAVSKSAAVVICILLILVGLALAYFI